jgi:hypothetical protein
VIRPTYGHCQRCRTEVPLDDGRHVAEHARLGNIRCTGSGLLCTEARDRNKEAAAARAAAKIDDMRADYMAMHDAVWERRLLPAHQIIAVRRAALAAYHLAFPNERPRRNRLWFAAANGKRRANAWGPAKARIFCTLCRCLLVENGIRGRDTEGTREHTTLCALERLSGIATYADPKERNGAPAARIAAEAV